MSHLPLVNVFEEKFKYRTRKQQASNQFKHPTSLHVNINEEVSCEVTNHLDAAKHILEYQENSTLQQFIITHLNQSKNYKKMINQMPTETPLLLSKYQSCYPNVNLTDVSIDINKYGKYLSEDQYLFHGGLIHSISTPTFTTNRPLSTSLCPQMAFGLANWLGKAYDSGVLNLYVLRVVNPKTKVFCYDINGINHGVEAEILFAAEANISIKKTTFIKNDRVYKTEKQHKLVPLYVIEADIS